MCTGKFNAGSNLVMDQHPIRGGEGGVEILLVASCYGNQDKLRPDGPLMAHMQTFYLHLHHYQAEF